MKNAVPAFLLLLFLCTSCIPGTEEEDFVEIEKTPDRSFIAELRYSYNSGHYFPVKDTLWLDETIYLELLGEKIYRYEVFINGEEILSGENGSFFKIDKGNRAAGAYPLTIVQYVRSGTGSIADRLEAEYAAYKEDLVLMVGPNNFSPEIESILIKEGTVQLSYKPYERGDFQAYEIYKYPYNDNFPYRVFVIRDQNQTTFNDTTYVGGWVTYEVRLNRGGEYLSSERYRLFSDFDPFMELSRVSENKVKLSWTKPPFYKSVKYYTLKEGDVVIQDHISPEALSLELESDAAFGHEKVYTLVLNAKVDDYFPTGQGHPYYPDRVSHTETITFGQRTPPIHSIVHSDLENAFYLLYTSPYLDSPWPNAIYKLDDTTLEIVDSVAVKDVSDGYRTLVLSPDGKNLFLLYDFHMQKIELNGFSVGEKFDFIGNLGVHVLNDNYAVSNNRRVVFHQPPHVFILDFATKEYLLITEGKGATHISADGNYFINGSDMYSFNGKEFILSGTLPYAEIRYVRFLPGEENILIATADQVILYDYKRKARLSAFPFSMPENSRPHLDEASMLFGYQNSAGMQFINIETGEEHLTEASPMSRYLLEGNVLFDTKGFGLTNY